MRRAGGRSPCPPAGIERSDAYVQSGRGGTALCGDGKEQGGAAGGEDAAAGDAGGSLHRSGGGIGHLCGELRRKAGRGGGVPGGACYGAAGGERTVYRQLPAGDPAAGAAADVGADAPQLGRRVSGQRAGGRVSGGPHRGGRHLRRGIRVRGGHGGGQGGPAVPDGAAAGRAVQLSGVHRRVDEPLGPVGAGEAGGHVSAHLHLCAVRV